MIKKLKIKFIVTTMFLITIVMSVAFVIQYLNTASELKKDSIEALHDIAFSERSPIDGLFNKGNKHQHLTTYTLDIDLSTNSCYIDGFGDVDNLTKENHDYINELINTVLNADSDEGIIKKHNMRYFAIKTHIGKRIVLLDKSYEDNRLNSLLISLLISGSIAFLSFLLISIIIANIAVKPVEHSIQRQKQFISDVSHELKTPITVISTNTDLIMTHSESTVANESKWLGYIKDETVRMSELVNMMLYLAKTDEADSRYELVDFNLSNACYEVALPFESVSFENGKELTINIEEDVFIKGEENSVKQLLVILLDNALKYSNSNGRIELNVFVSGDKATVSVFNTGAPIPRECIPNIFERFYRVDEDRSRQTGGSGLGLSIAKRIIEHNEATITVASSNDHGTEFSCCFKAAKNKAQDK